MTPLTLSKTSISFKKGYELGYADATLAFQAKLDILVAEITILNEQLANCSSDMKVKSKL